MIKKTILIVVIAAVAFFGLIQLIPYGHDHTNPAVVKEPNWDSPQTRALAKRACFDCHSNETVWPWYSNVAPVSWLVQHDTDEGRERVNFSDWGAKRLREPDEVVREVERGSMPPLIYYPTHPEARLSADEKAQLVNGLTATLVQSQ
jgi:hypothetical protein